MTTLLRGVVLLFAGFKVHLRSKIMRSKAGLSDDTKMLSTAEHKMRRRQLRQAACYISGVFKFQLKIAG